MLISFEQRTAIGKQEVAERTRKSVMDLLGKHNDLIDDEVAQAVVTREVQAAMREYETARAEGRLNDPSCEDPGITAYLDESEMVEEGYALLAKYGIEYTDLGNGILEVRLPDGTYHTGGACQFFGDSRSNPNQKQKPFCFPYDTVVRIDADNGQRWENDSKKLSDYKEQGESSTTAIESN